MRGALFFFAAMTSLSCGLFPSLESLTNRDASSATCAGDAGPAAVPAGAFCVDSTEVTNADYAAFLATKPPLFTTPDCAWKTTHAPDNPAPAGHGGYPVAWIDWCDAHDYCAWAGKRLCGNTNGGPLASADLDTKNDAWFTACGARGSYPYGNTFDPTACNGPEADAGLLPAGASPKCVGGFDGVFDMVGNLDEWIDSCAPSAPDGGRSSDACQRRSGSFEDPTGATQVCAFARTGARNVTAADIGFRCCSDKR